MAATDTEQPSRTRRTGAQLDDADWTIIELLSCDGRINNRDIAGRVSLTEATVAGRIRSLTERGILTVSPVFDWERAGYQIDLWILVSVVGRRVAEVAEALSVLPEAHAVQVVIGAADVVVHALLADRAAAQQFLCEDLPRVGGIGRVDPLFTIETLKMGLNQTHLPVVAGPLHFPRPVVVPDQLDLAILEALAIDGRRSQREISRELGVSDSTVRLRVRKFEDANMLRICGRVDPAATGEVRAFAFVRIALSGPDAGRGLDEIVAMPELGLVALTTGPFQVLACAVEVSHRQRNELILDRLRALPSVQRVESLEIVGTVKLDHRWARFQ